MNGFFSWRPLALVIATLCVLAPASLARAEQRPHSSRGTAHFISATGFEGTGTATHLGRYDEVGSAEFTPTSDPNVVLVDASATYTAANGDELYAVFAGELNPLTGAISATVTYVGGTGRFSNASGTASLSAQMLPNGSIDVAVEGTVDY